MILSKQTISKGIILLTILLVALSSCEMIAPQNPTPAVPQSTPTPIINVNPQSSGVMVLQTNEVRSIIQATVPPFDLDAQLELEREAVVDFEELVQETTIIINVDANRINHTISPLIYGVGSANAGYLENTNINLNSWGGDASSRYNWRLGNAWNRGLSGNYANTNLAYLGDDAALDFIQDSQDANAAVHFTLPTLGWVAKDNSVLNCTFPVNGVCTTGQAASCQSPGPTTDPTITSIPSNIDDVIEFVQHLNNKTAGVDILAIMHEPESWGTVHYDVHPTCTTYEEILNTYLDYAVPLRNMLPDVELAGPSTCCWPFYWGTQAGPQDTADHNDQLFLPWFLDQLHAHDTETGQRTLDVLDIHYTSDFDNLGADDARLRATNSLWDRNYQDEGTIREAIYLIPRMKELIAQHYPGTKLGLGEWSFGADWTVNGSLAIADALGIFGREGLYYASYQYHPEIESPGYYAFKIFTNYNDVGGKFGDQSVLAASTHPDYISSYAAIDSETGNLHLILVNKLNIYSQKEININISGFVPTPIIRDFRYDGPTFQGTEDGIQFETAEVELRNNGFNYILPPSSITHLVLRPEG